MPIKIMLLLLGAIAHMCTGIITPAIPKILKHYESVPHIKLLVKLVVTTPHLSIAICSPIIGLLVFKVNRRLIIMLSLLVYAVAGLMCFWIDDIYVIILSRALLGIAVSIIVTSVTSLIADCFDGSERNTMVGLQTAFMSIGTISFSLISGVVSDLYWKNIFLAYIVPSILIPFVAYFIIDPRWAGLDVASSNTLDVKSDHKSIVKIFQNIPIIWMIYLVAMLHMITYYLIPLQLPLILDALGHNSKEISYITASETLIIGLVAARYRRIKKNRDHSLICLISFSIMAGAFLVISVSYSYLLIMISCLIYGVGMGMMMPNNTLWLISVVNPKNRGIAIGGLTTATYIGKFLSAIVLHMLLEFVLPRTAYIVGSMVMLATGIVVIFLARFLEKVLNKRNAKVEFEVETMNI